MKFIILFVTVLLIGCNQTQQQAVVDDKAADHSAIKVNDVIGNDSIPKVIKTAKEWKAELNDNEYYVLREKGTERAFTGDLWDHKGEGTYVCAACSLPLFESGTKFKSGTGWPSFWEPVKSGHVIEEADNTHGMRRVEVLCGSCDGHLGHVFNDGPKPTGLRYCINSVSLDFIEKSKN